MFLGLLEVVTVLTVSTPEFFYFISPHQCYSTTVEATTFLNKCVNLYKSYAVAIREIPNEMGCRVDKREYCFSIDTCMPDNIKHYLSIESSQGVQHLETAYYKSVYITVMAMQTRTFACSFEGRPSALVFDIKQGISLYDIPTKSYIWQYRFQDLHSSSDDGKMSFQLIFKDQRSLESSKLETKDIESDEVIAIAFNLHSFLVTKIVAADPDFL